MTKSLCTLCVLSLLSLLLSLQTLSAWARRPAPAKTQYRWERMRINQVLPSQVFARLGLTHSTRYGFTRDGFAKGTPDPTFPAGLTDVVPYDTTHLLLVRGTPQGLAEFRARVLATESEIVSTGRWHVTVDLLSAQGDDTPLGVSASKDVQTDLPFQVTLGDPGSPQSFQLRVHVNGDATPVVSFQSGLFPSPTSTAPSVLTPVQVWTASVVRPVLPGRTAIFNDPAAARQAARRKLGLADEMDAQDYQVRVTLTSPTSSPNVGAVLPPPVVPQAPPVTDSVATPSPTEDNAVSHP